VKLSKKRLIQLGAAILISPVICIILAPYTELGRSSRKRLRLREDRYGSEGRKGQTRFPT